MIRILSTAIPRYTPQSILTYGIKIKLVLIQSNTKLHSLKILITVDIKGLFNFGVLPVPGQSCEPQKF